VRYKPPSGGFFINTQKSICKMAKRKTVPGITGQPIPEPTTPKQKYKLEQNRRDPKHLGTNVGGVQYSSGKKYYVPSTTNYNPRTRTFREFLEIAESVNAADRALAKSGILSRRADELQREIDAVTSGKKKPQVKSVRKITKQNYEVKEETAVLDKPATQAEKKKIKMIQTLERLKAAAKAGRATSDVAREEYEIDEKFSLAKDTSKPQSPKPTALPRNRKANVGNHDDWKDKPSTEWSDRPPAGKKLKSRATTVVGTQKRQDVETGVREECQLDEVKGFGGHIDPQTGKPTGKRSKSQQAHTTHWRNRQQGKDVPDPRRSKFKYGGATKSTTGSHEGDTPEGFAKKQDPSLAMTPSARMAARAKSLELKGKGRQANKIRAVASRPNMSEG
jgi:hypothetical protein